MGIKAVEYFFKPRSVMVVGASEREHTVGFAVMRNLIDGNFPGTIIPVNPRRREVFGIKAFSDVREIDGKVDLAIMAIPIQEVPGVIEKSKALEVKATIVLSAGGREIGEKGLEIEKKVEKAAREAGIRVIGPNCLGVICPDSYLNASFASHMPLPGRLAFISQSGAICAAILDLASVEGIGFSHFVSVGSMLDVDFGDLIDYLGNEPKVSSILIYMEGLTNIRKFMSAARSVSPVKPIIVLKAGRSPEGAMAVVSHTGSMAGEDILYSSAFERAGIVRVKEIGDLFDCAELLSKQPRPLGSKLVVITNAGGPGVMAADAIHEAELELASLGSDLISKLDEILPPCWSRRNPVDILGDATPERYVKAISACLAFSDANGILAMLTPQAMTNPTAVAEEVSRSVGRRSIPVLACWMGGRDISEGRAILNKNGIPTYDTPERAVKAFKYLYDYARNLEAIQQIPPKFSKSFVFQKEDAEKIIEAGLSKGILTEWETMKILKAYGFPVNTTELAKSPEEAVEIWRNLGEIPVVMKICSPDIIHKTEAGGVKLNITGEKKIAEIYNEIIDNAKAFKPEAEIYGVTVQPMIIDHDYEIILGAKKDPLFGPIVMFGWGGIYTEFIKDIALGFPPLNRNLANLIIQKTKVSKLLRGYRGKMPADFEMLEELLIRLSNLVSDFSEIVEIDMNPVVIREGKPAVVDARMVVKSSEVKPPMHLIISPYPNQYEWHVETSGGMKVFIRPVRPEDAPLFIDLFNILSPTTVYFRFFRPMKALPHSLLVRFTQIDYDREIALVAIDEGSYEEKMLGVARIIAGPERDEAEFAVLVGDPWQGKGIGAALLARCLMIAKEYGIKRVKGIVLSENVQMLALGRKLGFTICRLPDATECELVIDLERVSLDELEKA